MYAQFDDYWPRLERSFVEAIRLDDAGFITSVVYVWMEMSEDLMLKRKMESRGMLLTILQCSCIQHFFQMLLRRLCDCLLDARRTLSWP